MAQINPFLRPNPDGGEPILEMKLGIVFYLAQPPGPRIARLAYERFMQTWGATPRLYCPTLGGSRPRPWNYGNRHRFERQELPDLRTHEAWGYVFASHRGEDATLFMFHGARPVTEAGMASVIRLDLPWDTDPRALVEFARDLADAVPFEWAVGGWYFQQNARLREDSLTLMFAWARRYWGVAAHNLDVTMLHALEGISCINWLTVLGEVLCKRHPAAIAEASAAAHVSEVRTHGVLLQVEAAPRLIDRNLAEPLGNYETVARSLEPLPVDEHGSFGGSKWDDDNTLDYLERFVTGTV